MTAREDDKKIRDTADELGKLIWDAKAKHFELRELLTTRRRKPRKTAESIDENRDDVLRVRVAPSEKQAIKTLAETAGLEVSEYVRRALNLV